MSDLICPRCKGKGDKVLYLGLPFSLCLKDTCHTLWGVLSPIMEYVPFNGVFFLYTGNYWVALKDWLLGRWEEV